MNSTSSAMRPVRQARSRRTLDALLDALDDLLRDRSLDSIGIAELASAAGVTTGAFYARFRSKDDLLPSLYQRYVAWLDELREAELPDAAWSGLTPETRVARSVDFICSCYGNRPWLLRAMVIHSRRQPPAHGTEAAPSAQARLLARLVELLQPTGDRADPVSKADLEFAVYTVMTLAREVILFPHLPMARSLGLTPQTVRPHLRRILTDALLRSSTRGE